METIFGINTHLSDVVVVCHNTIESWTFLGGW